MYVEDDSEVAPAFASTYVGEVSEPQLVGTISAEAKAFIGDWLKTAAVKRATRRESAICLQPDVTQRLVREGAERGLKGHSNAQPCLVDLPLTLDMKFVVSKMADQDAIFPCAERLDGRTVRVEAGTVEVGYRVMPTMVALARNSL